MVRKSRLAVAAGTAFACLLLGPVPAQALTGALSAPACISGDTVTAPGCAQLPDAISGGEDSGLDEPQTVDVIDNSIYVTSQGDDAILHFERNPTTGAVTFANCITGEEGSGPLGTSACSGVASSTATGAGSGFNEPSDAVASGNGEWLYVTTQGDDAVLRFQRNTTNGNLTYVDCLTGDSGVAACTAISTATPNGIDSGLDTPNGIAISKSGTSVYVTSASDDAITGFSRVPATGVLTRLGCLSGETGSTASSCASTPDATASGDGTGLDQPFAPAISDDGDNVYLTTNGDASVVWFNRAVNGTLTFNDCITGDLDSAPASPPTSCGTALASATATPEGNNSGMERTQTLAISPDDESVYTGSQTDAAVVHFSRNTTNGDLTFFKCLSADSAIGSACADVPPVTTNGVDSGMWFTQSLALSPDGKSLYAAGAGDAAITSFTLDLADGEPGWSGCVTGSAAAVSPFCVGQNASVGGTGSGMGGLRSLAVTPDGLGLVGAATDDSSALRMIRSAAPDTLLNTGPDPLSNDPTAEFDFFSDENGSTFECRVDAAAFGPCTGANTHTTAALADGAHVFRVRALNDVPTADPTPLVVNFAVDLTAPDTAITSGPDGAIKAPTAEFAFTAADANGFQCRLDGGAFASCTSPRTLTGLADGAHTFEVRAFDAIGNTEPSPAQRAFTVDTSAPVVQLTKKPKKTEKTSKTKKKAKFVFSSDPGATFECSKDKGKDFKPCSSPYKKNYKLGKHTFSVRSTDAAGNAGPTATVKWKVKRKN